VKESFDPITTLLPRILPLYIEVLERLARIGAQWVQIDEPILVKDLEESHRSTFKYVLLSFKDVLVHVY
jgi:5-methyltetrahydropteroyltriglutamate--homocysteine methyltransferase